MTGVYCHFLASCDVEGELDYRDGKTSWKTVEALLGWREEGRKGKNEDGGDGIRWCYQVNLGTN
jgi:hypothetical protein